QDQPAAAGRSIRRGAGLPGATCGLSARKLPHFPRRPCQSCHSLDGWPANHGDTCAASGRCRGNPVAGLRGPTLTPEGGLPTFRPALRILPRPVGHHKETDPMPSGATLAVSDADFDKVVLQSSEPVLVDFFAEWCGPCKAMAPALEQVAAELQGKVKVAKLDVDQNPAVTQKYAIQAMPTLLIFKGGKKVAERVGALTQK